MSKSDLYEKIKAYKPKMRMHMPGHKGKLGKLDSGIDVTELSFSDNLLNPNGEILRLNEKLAKFYGSERANVLTCGGTSGIHIMLSKMRGKRLIVDRFSHMSVYNAMKLYDITPIFINRKFDFRSPVIDINEVISLLPVADGAILTYPTYYGDTFNIRELYKKVKDRNKVLLIDSSHGSHFAYSEKMPKNAAKYSDICVFSLHKTTLALTQAALITSNGFDLRNEIMKIHSTSPSYLICCSIDISHTNMLKYYYKFINDMENVLPQSENHDMTRLVYNVQGQGLNGFAAGNELEKKGIFVEMRSDKDIVCIVTPMDTKRQVRRLLEELKSLRGNMEAVAPVDFYMSQGENFLKDVKTEFVDLSNAEGRVCMQNVVIYPPGIPFLTYGDVITKEAMRIIDEYKNTLVGITDSKIEVEENER